MDESESPDAPKEAFETNTEGSPDDTLSPMGTVTIDPDKCRAVDCNVITTRPSGFCEAHETEFNMLRDLKLMTCRECPGSVSSQCKFKGGEFGICHFEMHMKAEDFNEKENLVMEFKKLLNSSRVMLTRLERRLVSEPDPEVEVSLQKEWRMLKDSFAKNQLSYMDFMGWAKDTHGKDDKLMRLQALKEALGNRAGLKTAKKKPVKQELVVDGAIVHEDDMPPIDAQIEVTEAVFDKEAAEDNTRQQDALELEKSLSELDSLPSSSPEVEQGDDEEDTSPQMDSQGGEYKPESISGAIKGKKHRIDFED